MLEVINSTVKWKLFPFLNVNSCNPDFEFSIQKYTLPASSYERTTIRN